MSYFYKNTVIYSYSGTLYVGGYSVISIYASGTQNLIPIFSDPALSIPTNNPITADQNGSFSFWVDDGSYDMQMVFTSGNINLTSTVPSVPMSNPQNYYQLNNTSTGLNNKYLFSGKGLVVHDTSSNMYYMIQVDNNQLNFVPLGSTLNL